MKELFAVAIDKPAVGPAVSLSASVLYWIGVLTPYLAFLALCLGIVLTWRSWRNAEIDRKIKEAQLAELLKQK